MAKIRDVVIDCRHPTSTARFWAAALDLAADDAGHEAERLTAPGAKVPARYPGWITLADPAGTEFCIQRSESLAISG